MDKSKYKDLDEKLSEIISRVEQGKYEDIDEMLKDYDEGVKLIKVMQDRLEKAKNKINKVK